MCLNLKFNLTTAGLTLFVSNNTQTTAYLVGLTAGDKLVAEYELDVD